MSRAKTSHKPEPERDYQASAQDSGSPCETPFARFAPDTSSSKTSPDSAPRWVPVQENLLSQQSSLTWPKQGMWDLGYAYALPTSERPTNETGSSLLLPTPNAYESTPAQKYVDEVRENLNDPHKRLYLPGRKWHSQRTLSRMAPLLPTPGANDSTGGEGSTRRARQQKGTGGPALRDLKNLLPTPTVNDAKNTGGKSQEDRRSLPLIEIVKDVSGGSTPRPSYVGKESSDDPHLDQLTIEDD